MSSVLEKQSKDILMLNRIILLLLLVPAVTASAGNVSLCESVFACCVCVIMAKCSPGDRLVQEPTQSRF